jgi:MFS family permease
MFSDAIKIKALLAGFLSYIIFSIIAMVILVPLWMPSGITDPAQLSRLAESDATLLAWQFAAGTIFCILAGTITTKLSGTKGLKNSLVLGSLFLLYGILGIFLHPNNPILIKLAVVLTPIPLAVLGGWIGLRLSPLQKTDA